MSDFGSDCESENNNTKNVVENNNCPETVFEDPVVKIFRGFQNVPEKAIRLMKDMEITYKDLSALNDEDLALFGISNPFTRSEILSKLANTPNQNEHYDSYVAQLDKVKYKETVYKNVRDQLRRIDLALRISQHLHQTNPIDYDILADENVYFSTLNVKALEAIKSEIDEHVGKSKSNSKTYLLISLIGLTLIGSFIIFRK